MKEKSETPRANEMIFYDMDNRIWQKNFPKVTKYGRNLKKAAGGWEQSCNIVRTVVRVNLYIIVIILHLKKEDENKDFSFESLLLVLL